MSTARRVHYTVVRRLLITLLLAHLAGSYGLVLGLVTRWGPPRAEIWLTAPFQSPAAVAEVTTLWLQGKGPWATAAAAVGGYALAFAAVIAWRFVERRQTRRVRRRRQGLCTECGYDLTGNVSGKCPECGTPVSAKARLLARRNA